MSTPPKKKIEDQDDSAGTEEGAPTPDEDTTDEGQDGSNEGDGNESEDEGTDEETPDGDEGTELPEWAQEKLSKANREAKNLRTRLREAEKMLENVEDLEAVKAIVSGFKAEREAAERDLLLENVALKYKLPESLQKRITGSTREEMESDAKELADLFGTADGDDFELEGGLNPRGEPDEADPRKLAAEYGRGRKRR